MTHYGPAEVEEEMTEETTPKEMEKNDDSIQSMTGDLNNISCIHPESERSKTCALKVFGLIQLALQCGPLKGSNPGYFKRCGRDVAQMAHTFLVTSILIGTRREQEEEKNDGHEEKDQAIVGLESSSCTRECQILRFTEKQGLVIQKWIKDAEKAIVANRPPSKSALKLQQTKKTQSKKKKKKKK